MNQFLNRKTAVILLVIALIAAGLLIAVFYFGPHKTLCTGKNCSPSEQNTDANIPFSKGPVSPPQVGTPNIPLPE